MTLKQLAERIGVSPRQVKFELESPCNKCKRMGGTEVSCGEPCAVKVKIYIEDR